MQIKSVIKSQGFTQKQVADALGVTESSMSQTVNNENVSLKMLRRIADIIGCKVGDFFQDEMTETPEQNHTIVSGKTLCPKCGAAIGVELSLFAIEDGDNI